MRWSSPSLVAVASTVAAPAAACRAVPPPHDPARTRSDVVLVATVASVSRDGVLGPHDAVMRLRVDRVPTGRHPARPLSLAWTPGGDGRCPSRGPLLREGERVVVYQRRHAGEPLVIQGWMPLDEALRLDPVLAGRGRPRG